MLNSVGVVGLHVRQTGRLLCQYGLVLVTLLLGARLLETLLMHLAVELGMVHRFAGLVAVIAIILLQLVVFVAIFLILRDRPLTLPQRTVQTPGTTQAGSPLFAGALLAVLIPFYAYYAGWGFLGNTLRDYSRAFLSEQWNRIDFQDPDAIGAHALQVDGTLWLLIPVALIWWLRRMAKARYAADKHTLWPLIIVACEATWVILALFVISGWKSQFVAWLASFPPPSQWLNLVLPAAQAAVAEASQRPVDWPTWLWGEWLSQLFRYALLPLIWFNLGAIVYGHNLSSMAEPTQRIASPITKGWSALPKPLTDFIGHFWLGLLKRWHAVANGVLLAASAGVWLTVSILVLWRLADWLGRWAWVGVAHLIGPQDGPVWSLAALPLNLLFGMPGQPQSGIVVLVVQFCVLAAGLSIAMKARTAATTASA